MQASCIEFAAGSRVIGGVTHKPLARYQQDVAEGGLYPSGAAHAGESTSIGDALFRAEPAPRMVQRSGDIAIELRMAEIPYGLPSFVQGQRIWTRRAVQERLQCDRYLVS